MAVILSKEFGPMPWILQCMNGVQECVQNSVQMLSGQAPVVNAQPISQGGQYAFPARTAAELRSSQKEVAHGGTVSPAAAGQLQAAGQAEQAMENGQVDMFELLQQQAGLQDPASQGMPAQEAPANEPGSDEWIV